MNIKKIFDSFEDSLSRLEGVLQKEKTMENRDATIKRFEFTAELSWKCIQKFLADQKIFCRSPKECLKEGFKFGLVEDDARWLEIFEDRNLTAHTYDEETAKEVYSRIPQYLGIFNKLKETLQKNYDN